jgi:hypothetical protein
VGNKRYSCIGLYNPKSPENVGSVMRAAGCLRRGSVFYTGVRYERARDFITDTKKVHRHSADRHRRPEKILPLGCIPVAVELVEGACPNTLTPIARCTSSALKTARWIKTSATGAKTCVHPDDRLHEPRRHRQRGALRPHGQRRNTRSGPNTDCSGTSAPASSQLHTFALVGDGS